MTIAIRTVSGYIEVDEKEAARLLACSVYDVVSVVTRCNDMMNYYHPISKEVS